jgi:phosphate transport system protein
MAMHMERAIEGLKKLILSLGALVEESVHQAVKALEDRNKELAEKIIKQDIEIDHMEVEVEEECLKILALHQPVAVDLRFIIAVLKINTELERIGDLSVNIAGRAVFLSDKKGIEIPFDLPAMSDTAQQMLKWSIDSLVNMDAELARTVLYMDDEIDNINRNMYSRVKELIKQSPDKTDILIQYLSVSRYIERIADQVTNIAEDVVYMVEGKIVRHRMDSLGSS